MNALAEVEKPLTFNWVVGEFFVEIYDYALKSG